MGQQDKSEKLLEEHNDVFADIINVCIYGGRMILLETELQPSTARSQYKADDSKLHENERDISKYWNKGGVTFALYAIENQTDSDKRMPLRIIAYDGANYRSQLLKKNATRFYPCISVVLYFGMKRWNTSKNLKELLDIPAELEPLVNDYRIHVIEVAYLTDEQVRMFKSDFRVVAEFFTQKRKNQKYHPTPLVLKHVDEVLKMLSVFGGMTEFEKAYQSISQKERRGDLTMCEFIQRTIRDDVQKGIAEGLAKCMAEEFPKRLDEEVSKRLDEEVSKRLDKEVSKRLAEELPKHLDEEVSKRLAEELPKHLDEEVSKRLAEELSKKHSDILLSCIQNLQKNLNCTLSDALAYLGKTFEEYTQAMQLLNPS